MIDRKKRITLKFLGGSAVIATASPLVMAGSICLNKTKGCEHAAMEDIIVPITSGTELTISLSIEPEPTVRLTNHSSKVIIVRHVYPGIVHADAQIFDINSIFENSAYAIGAGSSRNVLIAPASSSTAEAQFPRELYKDQPQRLVAVTGRDRNGRLANSSRSYFA